MLHPRRALLWSYLGVFVCMAALAASLWLWKTTSSPAQNQQVAQVTQFSAALRPGEGDSPTPADTKTKTVPLPPPPQELWDEDESFEQNRLAEGLPEPTSPSVRAADKISSEVIETGDFEEAAVREAGPSLGDDMGTTPVAAIELSKPPVQQQSDPPSAETEMPAAPKSGRLARAMANSIPKVALLPDWLRQLPDTVATGIATLEPGADSAEADSEPAEPESEPAAKVAAEPAPAVEPVRPATPAADAKAQQTPQNDRNDLWHEPETLVASLKELSGNRAAAKWAAAVLRQVHTLGPAIVGGSDEATAILDRLAELSRQTPALTAKLSDKASARRWGEVSFALARRIDIWRQVVEVGKAKPADLQPPVLDAKKLADALAKIEELTGASPEGQAWREFLLIDAIKQHCAKQPLPDARLSRETARLALVRMTRTPLTPQQRRFVSSPPVAAVRVELWRWAVEPIGIAELLRTIERYESTRSPTEARRLAIDCQSLWASPVEARRRLADRVDVHYRNANFRFAVTQELLNDLIPEQNRVEYAPVTDTVLRHPVQGQSLMATELVVRMLPDPTRARLMLEIRGEMAALTTTDGGLAQFHNESESRYIGRKPLEIDMKGISVWPVDVYVQNETRLNSVETAVDGVPLINWLAKMAAKSQHDMNASAASEEMKQKIVARASERIDAEVRQRLSEVVERLNQRVFDPLNSLTLDPQLIEARTGEDRFAMRLRLGGEDQLGSHTPRPLAPSDSLASVQVHESVINNGIQRLQLDGRRFTVPELSRHVAASLHCPAPWPTNPENDDVKITFADQNPLVIHCREGRVELILSISRLSKSPRTWRNFQVRAFFAPVMQGRSAKLVRDGDIELIAPQNMGSQILLRGIFIHAFSKKAPLELIPEKIVRQPKLQNAAITQFEIVDGWVGLALGPKPQTATRRHRSGLLR